MTNWLPFAMKILILAFGLAAAVLAVVHICSTVQAEQEKEKEHGE